MSETDYSDAVRAIFEPLFEPWMDEGDQADLISMSCQAIGKTTADLGREIAAGVARGVSVEAQVALCRRVLLDAAGSPPDAA